MDRSEEFARRVEALSSSDGGRNLGTSLQRADAELNNVIAEVSKSLSCTAVKVSELAKLTKQRGLFTDKTAQIDELTHIVKTNITDLNQQLERAEATAKSRSHKHAAVHYQNLVDTLRNRLLQTTADFKQVLTLRTETLKAQDKRRNLYSASTYEPTETTLPSAFSSHFDVEGQQQAVRYSQHRAEGVESVQRMIGELGQIFQKVASMVTQQEELVQRIDEDIDSSLANVNRGQSELLSYFQRISSNRSLILKVFAILVSFVIFFVLFLT